MKLASLAFVVAAALIGCSGTNNDEQDLKPAEDLSEAEETGDLGNPCVAAGDTCLAGACPYITTGLYCPEPGWSCCVGGGPDLGP